MDDPENDEVNGRTNNNANRSVKARRITWLISDTFKQTDAKVLELSGGQLDIAGTAFLGLAGVGLYQIAKGNFAALPWYAAFWYALNIFLKAEREPQKDLSPVI